MEPADKCALENSVPHNISDIEKIQYVQYIALNIPKKASVFGGFYDATNTIQMNIKKYENMCVTLVICTL